MQRQTEEMRARWCRDTVDKLTSLSTQKLVKLKLNLNLKHLLIMVRGYLLQGRHLCRQLVTPGGTTECLQTISPHILTQAGSPRDYGEEQFSAPVKLTIGAVA